MAVTILECKTKRELSQFEKVPETLHKNDPYFVPPFPGSISKIFSPKFPFRKHGEMFPFIAYREGRAVGRIAAIVNHSHNRHYSDKTGFFGFFDSVNDREVAEALVNKASEVLKSRGLKSMRGPYNPTVNDECGVLAEGFESIPMVMMPYNPPYYLDLYDKLGLSKARDLFAFYISGSNQPPERILKICERVKRTTGVKLRSISLKNLSADLRIIHKLYNETLDRNWGFLPISIEDLEFAAADLKAIIAPELVLIAEKDGEPVGFSMVIPNINEIMWKVRSSGTVMRILKFIWYLKTQRPKEARLAVLGVAPQYRNKGVAALFYYETLVRGKQKFIGGELSWVEETNEEMISAIKVMGGQKYKSYRIYEKSLQEGNA